MKYLILCVSLLFACAANAQYQESPRQKTFEGQMIDSITRNHERQYHHSVQQIRRETDIRQRERALNIQQERNFILKEAVEQQSQKEQPAYDWGSSDWGD